MPSFMLIVITYSLSKAVVPICSTPAAIGQVFFSLETLLQMYGLHILYW